LLRNETTSLGNLIRHVKKYDPNVVFCCSIKMRCRMKTTKLLQPPFMAKEMGLLGWQWWVNIKDYSNNLLFFTHLFFSQYFITKIFSLENKLIQTLPISNTNKMIITQEIVFWHHFYFPLLFNIIFYNYFFF